MATEQGRKVEPKRRSSGLQRRIAGPPIEPTAEELARIDATFAELGTLGPYEILRVARTADAAQIDRAYDDRLDEFDVERFRGAELGEREAKLEAIVARLGNAYELLSSPDRRAAYDAVVRANRIHQVEEMVDEEAVEMAGAAEASLREAASAERVPIAKASEHPAAAESSSVPRAVKVELYFVDRSERTITLDIANDGFTAIVGGLPLPVGAECQLVLHLGPFALRGRARVLGGLPYGTGTRRVSFFIEELREADRERLARAVANEPPTKRMRIVG